nr:MAG TPA: hypothetical protein [Caudoviricetes sp.]
MIKKRITLSDWTYIGKYNVCYDWARGLCDYYLLLDKDGAMYRKQDIKTWFYVLTFVPICLINIVLCIIDGGLVEFEIPYKTLDKTFLGMKKDEDTISSAIGGVSYDKAKEIWNKYR